MLDYEFAIVMAPLDLDKYAEIAKQCKYLPENDLKVSAAFCFIWKCLDIAALRGITRVFQ